jgi:hypothetical protein
MAGGKNILIVSHAEVVWTCPVSSALSNFVLLRMGTLTQPRTLSCSHTTPLLMESYRRPHHPPIVPPQAVQQSIARLEPLHMVESIDFLGHTVAFRAFPAPGGSAEAEAAEARTVGGWGEERERHKASATHPERNKGKGRRGNGKCGGGWVLEPPRLESGITLRVPMDQWRPDDGSGGGSGPGLRGSLGRALLQRPEVSDL